MDANRRIIVVDDQEDLRQQVSRILHAGNGASETSSLIEQIRSRIGKGREESEPKQEAVRYSVDTVGQGREAFEKVKQSFAAHEPYALMFLDMRMPPGWDGMETAQRVRSIDKEIQIVIMTAYADYDQAELADRIGEPDKLLYIKKPFHPEEVRQLALAMTEKWNSSRREKEQLILTNRLLRENASLTRKQARSLGKAYRAVLNTFLSFTEASAGALLQDTAGAKEEGASTAQPVMDRLRKQVEQNGWPQQPQVDEDAGRAVYPLAGEQSRWLLAVEDKQIVYTFEQLRPYLDILAESAREVLMNAVLLQQHGEAQRLSTLGSATRMIAERVKTDVGQIRKAADDLQSAPGSQKAGEDIATASDRVLLLADEMLEFSEGFQREPKLSEERLKDVVQDALQKLQPRCERLQVELVDEIPADLSLRCDRALLPRALVYLLANSMDALTALPAGQPRRITLSAERLQEGKPSLALHLRDNGPDVPEEVRENLFEPFVSGAKKHGTGLGATIARQIVERHDGHIACLPNEVGAHFRIVLPRARKAEA